MRVLMYSSIATMGAVFLLSSPFSRVSGDDGDHKLQPTSGKSTAAALKIDQLTKGSVPEIDLLEAKRQGLVSVEAEGRGDGRMTITVTNRTRHALRVVLPPGLIAQSATGQMGGMGGMGGGMGGMGGGMGGGGGGMGGRGGGMGGGMGGMGGMGGAVRHDAVHDGNDDARSNDYVFRR